MFPSTFLNACLFPLPIWESDFPMMKYITCWFALVFVSLCLIGCSSEVNSTFRDITYVNNSKTSIWVEEVKLNGRGDLSCGVLGSGTEASMDIPKSQVEMVSFVWWEGDRTRPTNEGEIFRMTVQVPADYATEKDIKFGFDGEKWGIEGEM